MIGVPVIGRQGPIPLHTRAGIGRREIIATRWQIVNPILSQVIGHGNSERIMQEPITHAGTRRISFHIHAGDRFAGFVGDASHDDGCPGQTEFGLVQFLTRLKHQRCLRRSTIETVVPWNVAGPARAELVFAGGHAVDDEMPIGIRDFLEKSVSRALFGGWSSGGTALSATRADLSGARVATAVTIPCTVQGSGFKDESCAELFIETMNKSAMISGFIHHLIGWRSAAIVAPKRCCVKQFATVPIDLTNRLHAFTQLNHLAVKWRVRAPGVQQRMMHMLSP